MAGRRGAYKGEVDGGVAGRRGGGAAGWWGGGLAGWRDGGVVGWWDGPKTELAVIACTNVGTYRGASRAG